MQFSPPAFPSNDDIQLIPLEDGGVMIPQVPDMKSNQREQFDINNPDQNLANVLPEDELLLIGN